MKLFFSKILFFSIAISFWHAQLNSQVIFKHNETLSGLIALAENNGVSVADYDGDLDLDLFVVSVWKDEEGKESTHSKLYRNNGNGTFTDVTKGSGLENLLPFDEVSASYENFLGLEGFKNGAFWGDFDNDGYPDIFFTHLSRVQLFRNQGDGTFVDITDASGIIGQNECQNMGAVWFDFNNDSYLDIYIADWKGCKSNTLYKNNGDGTFEDVTIQMNLETPEGTTSYNPFPFDFNNDGWIDLYVTNDFREPNQLYINNAGQSFTEKASEYNLNSEFNDMGITVGDFNKDQQFDFYITTIANNVLYEGKSDNTFQNKAVEFSLKETGWSWGTRFADFDLDGDEDLIVVNGFKNSSQKQYINYYFENKFANNSSSFSITNQKGIEESTISVEVIDFDYDSDGDLDLIITNSDRNSFFYENTTIDVSDINILKWYQLSLQGTISNRDAIGTKITLTTDKDTFIRYYNGVGFLGQSLKPVHFGLEYANKIEELKIEWPSGHIDVYNNIELNSFGKAIENTSYQNLNISPVVKVYGCTDPNSCNYNPNATINDGSCAYAEVSSSISGPEEVGFFSTTNYSYNLNQGDSINWSVEGGEITSGQGSSSISVKWHFETKGKVSVVVTTSQCKSEEISQDININLANTASDKSIARIWNEALLEAIRGDFARPTIHARNLFHTSIAMYDAWAIYSDEALPYLIGNTVKGFSSQLNQFQPEEDIETSRKKAISYACYRLLSHRFKNSPSATAIQEKLVFLMNELNYDINFTDVNYQNGNAAALGNFIAETIINYGLQDGSRELQDYNNEYYTPINSPLSPIVSGNPSITDPNRWQSLSLNTFIDQSGNLITGATIDFLSPEWGNVLTFAMTDNDKSTYTRDGHNYQVYHDPLSPPFINASEQSLKDAYKKGFAQVSIWSSHLDASDGVIWDISPKSMGNISINDMPTNFSDYDNFYNLKDGGDIGKGYSLNPKTNTPYESQMVKRGDYTRVLAEFWADGPDSETPPGHWFTILNYVNDHDLLVKKLEGKNEVLGHLEWDVKSYFLLGGAMHDAAISAWSIKGWYDYIRPISAIRYMADLGQSSDSSLPNYHPDGILLEPGFIELVTAEDPLAFRKPENIGKIKLYTWQGHDFINNTETDEAGVDWILAENWWPYQRPSFVTPPFAGYVSGHSTFSSAAAEVLTLLTGDAFFPGGLGEFVAKKNEFLVFEEGPSEDIILQWATYRDASDQCSLSRIWGGIHPPADDIPGRLIGEKVGKNTFSFGVPYFSKKTLSTNDYFNQSSSILYPNPVSNSKEVKVLNTNADDFFYLTDINGRKFSIHYQTEANTTKINLDDIAVGVYILVKNNKERFKLIVN